MDQKHSLVRLAYIVVFFSVAGLLLADETNNLMFEADVMVPTRDGTRLAANIFRPTGDGRFPVILMRTPYGKPDEKWGEAKRYVAAGYVMVVQDCRGRGKSEGIWDPFRYDVQDGFDTQEWVAKQSWCNGDIGTAGGSYVGWTQWASAPDATRYLKAMVPMVPFGNTYDLAYCGGAFQLALLMGWGSGVGGVTLSPDKLDQAYHHLPLSTFGEQFDKKVPYLDEWIRHPSGHRIRVEVSSSNFPRFDRNPNTGHAFGEDAEMVSAKQTIFHDTEHPSHLLLPIIPR